MVEWIKSLFGIRTIKNSSTDAVQDSNMLEQFEAFLAARMPEEL